MESIHFEADNLSSNLEDDDEQILSPKNDNFIDDSAQEGSESPSFYRFVNQTRDLDEALNDNDQRDLQQEMSLAESRENVTFDEFDDASNLSVKFKKNPL